MGLTLRLDEVHYHPSFLPIHSIELDPCQSLVCKSQRMSQHHVQLPDSDSESDYRERETYRYLGTLSS